MNTSTTNHQVGDLLLAIESDKTRLLGIITKTEIEGKVTYYSIEWINGFSDSGYTEQSVNRYKELLEIYGRTSNR